MLDIKSVRFKLHKQEEIEVLSPRRNNPSTTSDVDNKLVSINTSDRLELAPKAKLLHMKMEKSMKSTKSILKSVYKAEDSLPEIGSSDKFLSLFHSTKNDCRILLNYVSEYINIRSISESVSATLSHDPESSLIAFDDKFKLTNDLTDKDQMTLLLELISLKESNQRKICAYLLDNLSPELISNEKTPETCSKDLSILLTVLRTFQTLGSAIKRIELTREHAEKAHQIMSLQEKIEVLQRELSDKSQELKEFKVNL